MADFLIEKDIVIDDVYCVLTEIRKLSGKKIDDLSVVKRFVTEEKNTKFYFDSRMRNSMLPSGNDTYLWVDTGFTDYRGKPIFISLLRNYDSYVGHITGCIDTLSKSAGQYFKQNKSAINQNIKNFKSKYESKITEREIKHIVDINEYVLNSVNKDDSPTYMKQLLDAIEYDFTEEQLLEDVAMPEENDASGNANPYDFNALEEEITIGLLLEKMDSMQEYVEELLGVIESMENKDRTEITELRKKNEEYKRAMVQMRTFIQTEDAELEARKDENTNSGHVLLGGHSKILVIGGEELGVNIMQGIAKTFGFEKKDLEFADYNKAKDYTDRIRRGGKYSAVIFGACPHKTTAGAGYSSAVERFKQIEGMPYTADARTQSGELKLTRESFRTALIGVYNYLKYSA